MTRNVKDLYPARELIEKAVNTAYPSNLKYRPTPADYLIAKFAVDSAVKKIAEEIESLDEHRAGFVGFHDNIIKLAEALKELTK